MARTGGWYYGWNVIALVVIIQMFTNGLAINCMTLFLGGWAEEFHRPVSDFALAQTIFAMVGIPLGVVVGWASDRFPARAVFGFGLTLVALFHLGIGFAPSPLAITLLFAIVASLGIGHSGAVPSQAVVSRWFVRRRGLAMGLTAFGLALGGVLLPPLVAHLIKAIGWRQTWIDFGIVIGVGLLPLTLWLLRNRPAPGADHGYLEGGRPAGEGRRLSIGEIVGRRNFWLIGIAFFCLHGVSLTVAVNLAPLVQSMGFTLAESAALISVMSVAGLVGKASCGLLADRFGNRPPWILIGLISAASVALLAVTRDFNMLVLLFIMQGLTQGFWTMAASSTATEFESESFGQAYGLAVMFCSFSMILPWGFARLNETIGGYGPGLLISAAIALIGTLSATMLDQPRHPASPIVPTEPAESLA
jgi:MFS family permease